MESFGLGVGGQLRPAMGDMGILTLKYTKGRMEDMLRVRAKVVHVSPTGIGLLLLGHELTPEERRVITRVWHAGSDTVRDWD